MRVVLATSNPGKAREAQAILAGSGIDVGTLPIWLGEIETGATYLENARLKACSASRVVLDDVLAEDAGIEVDALAGLPGVHSARFAGPGATSERNNRKLLRLLEGVPASKRTARYRIVAVLRLMTGEEITGEGVWNGRLLDSPRGEGGFGYDPLFVPNGDDRTVAELTPEEKNAISHRAQALREIATRIAAL
jgi:XTP/dITP diphosphohydrolase